MLDRVLCLHYCPDTPIVFYCSICTPTAAADAATAITLQPASDNRLIEAQFTFHCFPTLRTLFVMSSCHFTSSNPTVRLHVPPPLSRQLARYRRPGRLQTRSFIGPGLGLVVGCPALERFTASSDSGTGGGASQSTRKAKPGDASRVRAPHKKGQNSFPAITGFYASANNVPHPRAASMCAEPLCRSDGWTSAKAKRTETGGKCRQPRYAAAPAVIRCFL